MRAAIEQADEYVWIYTEKPRWWSEAGRPVDLPAAYIDTVQRVRRGWLVDCDPLTPPLCKVGRGEPE